MDVLQELFRQVPSNHDPAIPRSLRKICLKQLAVDDVLVLHLSKIQDIPINIFEELLNELSIFGLDLLESAGLLRGINTDMIWKDHFCHSSRLFGCAVSFRGENGRKDFKSMYFENLFINMLNHGFNEVILQQLYPNSSPLRQGNMQEKEHHKLKSLNELFKFNLTGIKIFPYQLASLQSTLESDGTCEITKNIRKILFCDFWRFKDRHLWIITDLVNPFFFPNLETLSFRCCKFDSEAVETFSCIVENFIESPACHGNIDLRKSDTASSSSNSNQSSAMPVDQQSGVHKDGDLRTSEDFHTKRKELEIEDVCLDEALSCKKAKTLEEDKDIDLYDFDMPLINEKTDDEANTSKCQLRCLEFINCHLPRKTIKGMCEFINKLPNLEKFTLLPEFPLRTSVHDVIATACGYPSLSFDATSNRSRSAIESIKIHDSEFEFYSKKLFLWHPNGDCNEQFSVYVPSPKHIELVDCQLDTFFHDCSCVYASKTEIYQPDPSQSAEEGIHTEQCSAEFNWVYDSSNVCICNWRNLETINLSFNKIRCKGASALSLALRNAEKLKSVRLSECGFKTEGCRSLFIMASSHPCLQALDVSGNLYETSKDDSLAQLISTGSLLELTIDNCIGADGLTDELLAAFTRNSKLITLNMAANRLGDKGISKFSKVFADPQTLSSLKKLNLEKNLITSSIKVFAEALLSSGRLLDLLSLSGNKLNLKQLRTLKFYGTNARCTVKYSPNEHRASTADFVSQM